MERVRSIGTGELAHRGRREAFVRDIEHTLIAMLETDGSAVLHINDLVVWVATSVGQGQERFYRWNVLGSPLRSAGVSGRDNACRSAANALLAALLASLVELVELKAA